MGTSGSKQEANRRRRSSAARQASTERTLVSGLPESLSPTRSQASHPSGPEEAQLWTHRGDDLDVHGAFNVGAVFFTKQACYAQALKLDPQNVRAWNGLGLTVTRGEMADVPGVGSFNEQGCFLQALELDPEHSRTWYNLGVTMQEGDTLEIKGHGSITQQDCFLHAIRLDAKFAAAWYNLGTTLAADGGSLDVEGVGTLSQQECLLESLKHDSTSSFSAKAWNALGASMGSGEVDVPGRGKFTRQQCFIESLTARSNYAKAWANLADTLSSSDATVVVGGETISKKQCIRRSSSLR